MPPKKLKPKENAPVLMLEARSYDTILPFELIIAYEKNGSLDNMVQTLTKQYPELLPMAMEGISKKTLSFVYNQEDSTNIFLFLTDSFGYDILVHECIHIVFRIFEIIGSDINQETEEWFAYMNEFIFRQVRGICLDIFGMKLDMHTS